MQTLNRGGGGFGSGGSWVCGGGITFSARKLETGSRPVHAVITLRILAEKMSCYYSTQERQRRKVKAKVSIPIRC